MKNHQKSQPNLKKSKMSSILSFHKEKNLVNSSGKSIALLNHFTFSNELEFMDILLDHNANINIRDNDGNTPLMVACAFRRTEQINFLLKRGASPNDLDKEGMSALNFLCYDKELDFKKSEINITNSNNHVNLTKLLVQKETSLSQTINKDFKFTPLHLACYNNNLEMIKYLIDREININAPDCYLNTAFIILCKNGYSNIIKELLEMKYDIYLNAQNALGKTGIHYACENQDIFTIKLLLKAKVNLGLTDNEGNNPLHIACALNNTEIIDLLLNHIISEFNGGSPLSTQCNSLQEFITNEMEIINCPNHNHETPLFLVMKHGNVKMINKFLHLQHINISTVDRQYQNSLLHLACEKDLVNITQILCWLNLDPNIQNKEGNTPLHIVCRKGNLDLINIFLNNKQVNINIQNRNLETPLHIAASHKYENICLFLLDNEAKCDIEDRHGHTYFFIACQQGLYKVVKKLIRDGIDIHKQDSKGYTALHIACAYERVSIVKILLKYNADINAVNPNNNVSPYDIAVESQNKNLINLIENKKEVRLNKPTTSAIPSNQSSHSINKSYHDYKSEALTFMFSSVSSNPAKAKMKKSRSDILLKTNLEDNNGNRVEEGIPPLHQACEKGLEIKVKLFLDYGEDVNLLDKYDNSPLHYACTYDRINVVKILLQHPNININIKCFKSRITPFLCAAYNKNIKMMELLLDKGANINACDSNGASALFNLCKKENKDVFKFLLDRHINAKIQDKSGMTILHLIAVSGEKDLAPLILQYDPSIIDYQDIYGRTALHYASINNNQEAIKFFLQNNANVKLKDKNNNTPMDYLKDYNCYSDTIDDMIKNINYTDNKGKTFF